jgi:hypothetical protein
MYLAPIHVSLAQVIKVALSEGLDFTMVIVLCHFSHLFYLSNMMLPDLLARLGLQVLVPNAHVNAALKCFVERLDTICGEEKNALVVLRETEKYRDE